MIMETPWEYRYAQRIKNMKSSAIREILKLTQEPEIISFAGGLPAPEVFPVDEIKRASEIVLTEVGAQALQYSPTEGYPPLREMIAEYSKPLGLNITIDNILITSGSQQALDLLGKVFINPGDRILVESPTYVGALQAWNAYRAEYGVVPLDDDGLQTDVLEEALRVGPKFIYVLPNFQNPTGVTLSYERRQVLVELTDKYGIPIIEDDPYGSLRYAGEYIPPIVVMDCEYRNNDCGTYQGNVIYLSTFSKTLAPGIRLAWVVAPPNVIRKMVQAKQGADLHTSTFIQMVAYEVARDGFLLNYIEKIRAVYGERRQIMLNALDQHFPPSVKWTRPEGGMFVWATLPNGVNAEEIFKKAVAQKVAFVPGWSFHATGGGENTMRLNFSNQNPERIQEGIARLGKVLYDELNGK
jgi:2-aminoadipate transaminase